MVHALSVCSVADMKSQTTQAAIYDLAAHPEYAAPLREEIEEITEKYGWTKKAVSQ